MNPAAAAPKKLTPEQKAAGETSWIASSMADPEVRQGLKKVATPDTGQRGGDKLMLTDKQAKKKAFREEGSLLTALAMQGLAKMDPFQGVTYRGETTSKADLPTKAVPGEIGARPNLTSTSKSWTVPLQFAGALGGGKDVALFWIIEHPPGVSGGRDITLLSAVDTEGEVLNMVGAPFQTKSLTQLERGATATGPHADFLQAILNHYIMKLEPGMGGASEVWIATAVAIPQETKA